MNGYEPQKLVEKPWGKEEWIELTDKYCLKKITIFAGCKTSLQYHIKKSETIYFLSGKALVSFREARSILSSVTDLYTAGPGYILRINPYDIHRIEAIDEDVVVMEASTIEVDDVVRLEDSYGRKGT